MDLGVWGFRVEVEGLDLGVLGGVGIAGQLLCLGHFQLGSYPYRSLIEGLYTLRSLIEALNSPPVVSFNFGVCFSSFVATPSPRLSTKPWPEKLGSLSFNS